MNPGIVEETGQTSRAVVDALKGNPPVLVLALCNLALVLWMYFALVKAAEFRHELVTQQHEFTQHAIDLLAKCVVHAP